MSGYTTTSGALAATFFGLFTIVAVPTLYVLTHKGLGRSSSLAAFATTAALYALAAIYTVAVLAKVFHGTHNQDRDQTFHNSTLDNIGTAVLTLTIVLSNAVVWSRVWVLWGHNKALCAASSVLLAITLVLGIIATTDQSGYHLYQNNSERWLGGFYWGPDVGIVVFWISMCTNALALILYLVKVLRMRSEKTARLGAGRRVARHFVRVLESGAFFAVLALLMVTFNMGAGDGVLDGTVGFSIFLNGAAISLLGASAVGIILLAATGYSETAFLDSAADELGLPFRVPTTTSSDK